MVGGARLSTPPRRREFSIQRGGSITSWPCDLGQIPSRRASVCSRVNGNDSNCPTGLSGGLDEGNLPRSVWRVKLNSIVCCC